MKKFEGMLFCTDLDGTLFNDVRKVSKENIDAIEYFKSEGGLFTFITGRVPLTALHLCDIIKPNAPFGCINGGGIYDHIKGEYLWHEILHPDYTELLQVISSTMPEVGIQYNTANEICFANENPIWDYFRHVTGVEGCRCGFGQIESPVIKVVLANENEEVIRKLDELLKTHPKAHNFSFIRSEAYLYEILPKGVSKGNSLSKMAEMLPVRKTIAVGDYYNDISMIKTATIGFAVKNAVPELKAVADYETVNNNQHAIAKIIEKLEKIKKEGELL